MHRRALLLRASVVAMLVTGALAVFAAPAFADDKIGVAVGPSTFDLSPGESRDFGVDVTNKLAAPPPERQISIVVQAPAGLSGDLVITGKTTGCTGSGTSVSCTVSFAASEAKSFTFSIAAKGTVSVGAGQSKQANGTVTASGLGGDGGQDSKQLNITVRGPNQAPVVPEVSGTVADSTTGAPIKDAVVTLTDGASVSHTGGSDANGRYKITSKPNDPIAPGSMSIVASKDNYEGIQKNLQGKAGVSLVNQKLQLKPVAATASAAPTTAPTDTAQPTPGDTATAGGTTGGSSGTGLFSWVLIGLGALLVLLGIGAIVLLLVRRRDGDYPDDELDPRDGRRGPAPVPAGRGGYRNDPTMMAHGGMADPTMMAGRGGAADATAMIRPPRPGGDYPDPYGASPRSAYPTSPSPAAYPPVSGSGAGYGAGGGYAPAYGAPPPPPPVPAPAPTYPPANGYGPDPAGYSGYPGGGYSGDPRGGYDEPARHYDAGGGYPASPGYGAPSDGYEAGYDRGGGYEPRQQGYDAGYDRGGAPYDRVPEQRSSYGSEYGPNDGYYDDPAATPSRRSTPSSRPDRRSLDWLDD